MSSLLQNVLASRLAQATLGTNPSEAGSGSSEVASGSGSSNADASEMAARRHGEDDWEHMDEPRADAMSDEEWIGVMSAPGTVPGTPHISRPSSPGVSGTRTSSTKRSGLSRATTGISSPRRSKTDPLRSLPREVSQRIFLSLPTSALIALSQVNRRYRRSATLNYCWYQKCNAGSIDFESANAPTTSLGSLSTATWTRRASKTDWKTQYAKQKRIEAREQQRLESLPGSGTATPSRSQRLRDEGHKTVSDLRQDEWQAQRDAEEAGYSKTEMREWYKAQGGTKGGKLKGKRNKGGVKTATDKSSLWE